MIVELYIEENGLYRPEKEIGNTILYIDIKKQRSLQQLKMYWKLINNHIDSFGLQAIPVSQEVKERLMITEKKEHLVMHYVLKYLFLPLEKIMLPSGQFVETVASVSFEKMNSRDFSEYLDKCQVEVLDWEKNCK
jgi:hypothetical protein